jgi:hypothetical protein
MSAPAVLPVRRKIDDHVERLRMQDGWGLKIFARGRGAGEDKNARADDRANAERRQRPRAKSLAEPVFGTLGIRDQLVDRFAAEKLVALPRGGVAVGGDGCARDSVSFTRFSPRGNRARTRNARASMSLPEAISQKPAAFYRLAWPRANFFTLRFFDPRA